MNIDLTKILPISRAKTFRRAFRRFTIMVKNDIRALKLSVDN